jgi:hypothetical protein
MLSKMTSPVVLPTVSYQNRRHWQRWGVKLRGPCSRHSKHQWGTELGLSGLVNESELLINVVKATEPKMLSGSNQHGQWSSSEVTTSADADVVPLAKRQHLTRSVIHAERGQPVTLPGGDSKPPGEPTELPVGDHRKSECPAVMVGIEVEITSRESGQTSVVVSLGEKGDESTLERKAPVGGGDTSRCAFHHQGCGHRNKYRPCHVCRDGIR